MIESLYLIGSMRNPNIPDLAKALRELGVDVFDDWHSPGPETDDYWQAYEKHRGRTFREALDGYHAKHVFALDKLHLDRCDAAAMVLPAGKSGHLELGYTIGRGKPAYIILPDEPPERFDIMYVLATRIFDSAADFVRFMSNYRAGDGNKWRECEYCDGTGDSPDAKVDCPECQGEGRI